MDTAELEQKLDELILNWKLRLIVSALFSILGFALFLATLSGKLMSGFTPLDQTIVAVSVFVVVLPVYLILADLPKIDRGTVIGLLRPKLSQGRPEEQQSQEEEHQKEQLALLLAEDAYYRHLPLTPIFQACIILICSVILSLGAYLLL